LLNAGIFKIKTTEGNRMALFYVCLSKRLKKNEIKVKILSEDHVPRKGEKIQIIGIFRSKGNAQKVARYPDTKMAWRTQLFLTDETMWDYLSHR
jgi:hypothetical protein